MKDFAFGQKYLDRWIREFPDAVVVCYDNAGHLLLLAEEKPRELIREIERFLI